MTKDDNNNAGGAPAEICPPHLSVFPSERFPAPLLAWEACAFGPEEGTGTRGYLITQPQTSLFLWKMMSGALVGLLRGAFLSDMDEIYRDWMTFSEARDAAEEALREWVRLHGRTLVLHVEAEEAAGAAPVRELTALDMLKAHVHGAGGTTAERGKGEAFSYCMPGGEWIGAETLNVDLQVWAEEQLRSLLN